MKREGDQARKAGAAGQAGEAGGAGEARKTSLTRRDMDREQTTAAATTAAAAAAAAFASINRSSCSKVGVATRGYRIPTNAPSSRRACVIRRA